jgi:tetratricopeptide (TPR) repeat protein
MSKISLCLIVGNVEEYIERCLDSFKPIADEICVVRAIGAATPDKTLDICRDKYGARVAEYVNAQENKDWPHVDNFAAARQQSFDMATGDYCFWCDSDDVLEQGAEIVRELADRMEYAAYVFPYKIFGRGIVVPRERMMLKNCGKWLYPVHECFNFKIQPIRAVEDMRVVITHMPKPSKTGSNDRNLRILQSIPESEMTAGLLYHLHGELIGQNRTPEAIEAGKKALQHPNIGKAEKYEIFLNLSRLSENNLEMRQVFLQQAYAADPTRREALGLLVSNSLDLGRNEDGLAYARQMSATPLPACEAWNSRTAAYGWVGTEILCQALRANGMRDEAESLRRRSLLESGGARITLIHATRGRPQKASMARKIWHDFAERPEQVEHIFVLDADDEESIALRRMHHLTIPPGGGCVQAWNQGCFAAGSNVFVQMSDDFMPPPLWDKIILERMGDVTQPKVLAVSDGLRTDKLLCMAICTREYWMQDWFLFHPWFKSMFSDNWFTELAYARKCVIEARDVEFTHEHVLKTGGKPDATYLQTNAPERYQGGAAILDQLRKREDWSAIPGWFNYWPFYQLIAQRLKDGDTVAEVGCWMGRSIIFLAQECKRLGKQVKFYAVDTFKGEKDQPEHTAEVEARGGSLRATFDANIARAGVADMITVLEGDSAEMAQSVKDGSLAFCYLDAAHDYESVKKDIAAWLPKLSPDGKLAGHDAMHEPVARAVKESLGEHHIMGAVWMRA